MLKNFLDLFLPASGETVLREAGLDLGSRVVPVRNDIPRFSPDNSYSSGNFSKLRELHATLQLDSKNATSDRLDTFGRLVTDKR